MFDAGVWRWKGGEKLVLRNLEWGWHLNCDLYNCDAMIS